MRFDVQDTIVAAASANGVGARGVIRLSGPRVAVCLASCVDASRSELALLEDLRTARRGPFALRCRAAATDEPDLTIAGQLLVWPQGRSYTRQRSAEFHGLGSPPLLAAAVAELVRCGARLAEPGEFTLRAFLAGRVDLTQAEAVAAVIDAPTPDHLQAALGQLAGGLAQPLARLRLELLALTAEIEAGLDFADEDLDLIDSAPMRRRLASAASQVASVSQQLADRSRLDALPRVVLAGHPNAGKSRLFNALAARCGGAAQAIVSPRPGATRDFLSATILCHGVRCELVDTAGWQEPSGDPLLAAAQGATREQTRRADLVIHCVDGAQVLGGLPEAPAPFRAQGEARTLLPQVSAASALESSSRPSDLAGATPSRRGQRLALITKIDLFAAAQLDAATEQMPQALVCSSLTGEGLPELTSRIAAELSSATTPAAPIAVVPATAVRCRDAAARALAALEAAQELAGVGSDELLAAELRLALHAIGEMTGGVDVEHVLDAVFSQFCIGK